MIQIQKANRKFFSEKEIWKVAWQISLALLHCHNKDIIHRDVKYDQVKLGDLSESTILSNKKYVKTKRIGTPLYISPEIIKHEIYDHRSDIWSFGIVLYHMTALEYPFYDPNIDGLMKQILYKNPKSFQVNYSSNLKQFIFQMLEKAKGKRPFISDIFELFPKPKIQSLPHNDQLSLVNLGQLFGIYSTELDNQNFQQYNLNKLNFEKKRLIDQNKYEIKQEFEVLKQRIKEMQLLDKKKRTASMMQNSIIIHPQSSTSINSYVNQAQILGGQNQVRQSQNSTNQHSYKQRCLAKRQFLNKNLAQMLKDSQDQDRQYSETQKLSRNKTLNDNPQIKSFQVNTGFMSNNQLTRLDRGESFESINSNISKEIIKDSPYLKRLAQQELTYANQLQSQQNFLIETQSNESKRYKNKQLKFNPTTVTQQATNKPLERQLSQITIHNFKDPDEHYNDILLQQKNKVRSNTNQCRNPEISTTQSSNNQLLLPDVTPRSQLLQNNKKYNPIQITQQSQVQKNIILPFKQNKMLSDNQLNSFYPFHNNGQNQKLFMPQSKTPHNISSKYIEQNSVDLSIQKQQSVQSQNHQTFSEQILNYKSQKLSDKQVRYSNLGQQSRHELSQPKVQEINLESINFTNQQLPVRHLQHKNIKLLGDRLKPLIQVTQN